MKSQQENTSSVPVLLRCAKGVDTLVKNRLCCEAAGAAALSSASTEDRIPHEKLRDAAANDATLTAQEHLPAKPVVGCTHVSGFSDLNATRVLMER